MKILFLFLDGVGLGKNDPAINPFARQEMTSLCRLLDGQSLLRETVPLRSDRATLTALDANLGVAGRPQSATGQATLLSGINVSAALGYHYGPKPNEAVRRFLNNGNLFTQLTRAGKKAALLNAYPPRYFQGILSGKHIYSAIPLAVTTAGLPLGKQEDLKNGLAVSADFTGEGWRSHLGISDTPIMPPYQTGVLLARLADKYDFSLFEYWLSDYAGHRQDMNAACNLLSTFDMVLQGLLDAWDDNQGLILITSDHGNMEDLSTRRHTNNPVPALVIGAENLRDKFCQNLSSLVDITPAIIQVLGKASH